MITFPLVFGWIHFSSAPNDQMTYVTYLLGFPGRQIPSAYFHRTECFFMVLMLQRFWFWVELRSRYGAVCG